MKASRKAAAKKPMMRAAILARPGLVLPSESVPIPRPAPGELLVRVRAALTCGTDLKAIRRGHPMIPMPGPFGHEFSGVVAEAGRGVRGFREADEVMSVHSAPCLRCAYCKKGLHNLCLNIMQTKALGAFAEYIIIPAHVVKQNTFIKPKRLPFEHAALLEPLACVVHGVDIDSSGRSSKGRPLRGLKGTSPLVIGAGPIGLMHVMLLCAMGAEVTIADHHAERLAIARKLGAHLTVRLVRDDHAGNVRRMKRAIKSATGGMGFDHVHECTGRPEVWEASIDYVRRGGAVTLFGGCPSGTRACFDTHRLHYDEITLRGDFHFTPADVRVAYEMLASGLKGAELFISGAYPLTGIMSAFDLLMQGRGVKYAVIP